MLFASRRTFSQLRRSATVLLTRISIALCMASFGVTLAATRAWAGDDGGDTTRVLAFGGMCLNCELSGRKLPQARFIGANFAGARLRQADMSAAVMNHTTMAGADLRDVNAYGAVFTGVSFAGANMTNASFVGTYLEGANFRGANLSGVNFSGAEMDRAVGLTQGQLNEACGDDSTTLPHGLRLRSCG